MCLLLKLSVITPEYNGDEGLNVGKALHARLHNALKAKKYYKTMPAIANGQPFSSYIATHLPSPQHNVQLLKDICGLASGKKQGPPCPAINR